MPVNCAAIPIELAERLLFGTVRGAYSGAIAAADGYVQAADGGGEMPPAGSPIYPNP